jgi:hippurate hydrolase
VSADPAFLRELDRIEPDLVEVRHRLHRHPEIGLDLPVTQQLVLDELASLGLEMQVGSSSSSVTAVLRGGAARNGERPAVLLRADMDALPVQERTGLAWASQVDGAMHACGHDLHVAMLIGGARLLASHAAELPGDVVLMFQPGEEGWDGARHMLDEGVLNAAGARVRAAYGMHVLSNKIARGVFSTRPGTMMSASAHLRVTVRGVGAHGSAPYAGRDPIAAMAEMITSLQTMITRRFDVFDPVVLTVGTVSGGSKHNIIPDDAGFEATIRTFSATNAARAETTVLEVLHGIAAAHGLTVDADYRHEYPATVNDPEHADFLAGAVATVFGDAAYTPMVVPETGSEDFSRVLEEVPGSYVMLGATVDDDPAESPSNHSPLAQFSDAVIGRGALLHAELARRRLAILA